MTDRTAPDRIKAYLDDLGKLCSRHGIWIEPGSGGTLLHVRDDFAAEYLARPAAGRDGVFEIDCYGPGAALDTDVVIVGDDHSPRAKRSGQVSGVLNCQQWTGIVVRNHKGQRGFRATNGYIQLASSVERVAKTFSIAVNQHDIVTLQPFSLMNS